MLANRIARAQVHNAPEAITTRGLGQASADWAGTTAGGTAVAEIFGAGADLAVLGFVSEFADVEDIVDGLMLADGLSPIFRLDHTHIGVGQFAGLWIVVLDDAGSSQPVRTSGTAAVAPVHGTAEADLLFAGDNRARSELEGGPDIFGGGDHADTVDGGRGDDSMRGRGGDDVIVGGTGGDLLIGGPGRDTLAGGAGSDTADDADASGTIVINLGAGRGRRSDAAGDRLSGIENVAGSRAADAIWGDDGDNVVEGRDGNDVVRAFGGADEIDGGRGDDKLDGGPGADTIDGGAGQDRLRFDRAPDGIAVDLAAGIGSSGWASGDVLVSVEQVVGSVFDDRIVGTRETNVLQGLAGDDTIAGGAGRDYLYGQAGKDTLIPGAGEDRLKGGTGADLLVFSADDDFNHVRSFERRHDVIDLPDDVSFDDLTISKLSWGTRMDFEGTTIALVNVTGAITDDNFM